MSQKEKYLNSAQKFIAKGQLDRAVKDYEQAVAIDPQDLRCRQKLAELLVRANRKDDAIREFETIGKYYADNGYFLKAIAVYKQMQKVDPQNMDITVTLGDLNDKQGLKGNALAEYQTVVDFHQRAGNLTEAGKALDRMMAVDEGNVSIQLKKAEILHAGHLNEKAYQEFVAAGVMLAGTGDDSGFRDLTARITRLFPEKSDFLTEVARGFLDSGRPEDALRILDATIAAGKASLGDWELLLGACKAAGDLEKRKTKAREMAALFPKVLSVRELLLEALADTGEIDEGISVLNGSLKDFRGADWSQLEPLYRALLEKDPANITLLQGLKGLYERAGKQSKVNDIETRIALLSGEGTPVADAGAFPSAGGAAAEEPSVSGWDSELDLALSGGEAPEDSDEQPEEESSQGEAPAWEESRPSLSMPESPEAMEMDGGFHLELPEGGPREGGAPLEIELPDLSFAEMDFDLGTVGTPATTEEPMVEPAGTPPEIADEEEEFHYLDLGDFDAETTLDVTPEDTLEDEDLLLLDEVEEVSETLHEVPWEESGVAGEEPPAAPTVADVVAGLAAESGRAASDEDTETHFNLGIAYMEMGLYGEAVAEFLSSAVDPGRQVASATLAAVCFREKGDLAKAEEVLSSLLGAEGLSQEEVVTLRYEYALLLETAGRVPEAVEEYRRVQEADPGYRGVDKKIAALQGEAPAELPELELLDEDLEELL